MAKWLLSIWHSLIATWLLAISFIANDCLQFGNITSLNTCWQFSIQELLNICWQFGVHVLLNICWRFSIILLLNSNNRVSSFSWTRESKLCFLTRFSYFSRYFLILVFLWNRYLLISSRLSRLHGNPISPPGFLYLWHFKVVRRTCAPIFLAQNVWVSQSKMLKETW